MSFKGCISCRKCEFIRGIAFCGATKLTRKQLYSEKGYCSEFEEKSEEKHDTIFTSVTNAEKLKSFI